MSQTRITLPPPISTNNLFANKKQGRGRTQEYNTWRWQATSTLSTQKPLPRFTGAVRVRLLVGEKGTRVQDIDNTQKAYLDALVAHGVIVDDSRKYVRGVTAEWVADFEGCEAVIELVDNPHKSVSEIPCMGEIE